MLTRDQVRPTSPILSGFVLGAPVASNAKLRPLLKSVRVTPSTSEGKIFVADVGTFAGHVGGSLRRAPGAQMQPISVNGPTDLSFKVEHRSGIAGPLPWSIATDSQFPEPLQRYYATALGSSFKMDQEVEIASALYSSSAGWGTNTTVVAMGGAGVKWNAAGADILGDIEFIVETYRAQSHGNMPRDLVFGHVVAAAMRADSEIKKLAGAIKYGDAQAPARLNNTRIAAALADEFGIERVTIADARVRTSNPGQTLVTADVVTDSLWCGTLDGTGEQIADNGIVVTPSALALIECEAARVWSKYEDANDSWYFYGDMRDQVKVLDTTLGVLIRDIL